MEHINAAVLLQNDYASLAIATAVAYDCILTFSDEVEYVWNKRWTRVSTLFVLIRYLGCYCALSMPFSSGTIASVSAETYVRCLFVRARWLECFNRCYRLYIAAQFAFLLFLAFSDVVMILSVFAMYSRSKLILCILLVVYIPEVVLTITIAAVASTPQNTAGKFVSKLGRTFFLQDFPLYHSTVVTLVPFFPAAITCSLIIFKSVKEWREAHRVTGRWTLNRYLKAIFKESIVNCLSLLLFGLVTLHCFPIFSTNGTWWCSMLSVVGCVPVFTLMPRFVLTLRSLYARDTRVYGPENDTGFGLSLSLATMFFAEDSMGMETEVPETPTVVGDDEPWSYEDLC